MQITSIPQENVSAIKKETVSELVRRHLRDQHHNTTEEELRDALLETGAGINSYEKNIASAPDKIYQIH